MPLDNRLGNPLEQDFCRKVVNIHGNPPQATHLSHLSLCREVPNIDHFAHCPNGSLPTEHFEQIADQNGALEIRGLIG